VLGERNGYWTTRRTFNRRRLLQGTAVGTIGLVGVGLVGCGGDDDDDDDTPAPGTPGGQQTPAASPAVGQPIKGGTLRIGENSAPATWDAYVNSSGPAQAFWGHMTNRILRLNVDDKDSFTLQGDVALSVPEQPDLQTLVIKLRDNVTYQDIEPVNGRKLTADDVAFSIQRYKDIGQQKSQLAAVETIEVTDEHTVTLKLNKPTVGLTAVLGDAKAVWIMAKEVAQEEIGPQGPFIGTGPFMFEKYDTEVQITYRKNPNYWETGLPHVDVAERPIIESLVTEIANFRSKNLDHFTATNKDEYEELRAIEGVQEVVLGGSSMQKQEFALHVPPFNNRLVRQALSMAVNRDDLAVAND
jgi:peptide/nickel transport system substrate-binding protein